MLDSIIRGTSFAIKLCTWRCFFHSFLFSFFLQPTHNALSVPEQNSNRTEICGKQMKLYIRTALIMDVYTYKIECTKSRHVMGE